MRSGIELAGRALGPSELVVPILEPRLSAGFFLNARKRAGCFRCRAGNSTRQWSEPDTGLGTEIPSARWLRPASSRVAGIKGERSLQFAVFRHRSRVRPALLTAPAEMFLRDVILTRPAVFAALSYSGLLANGLSHNFALEGCARPRRKPVI